LQRAILLSREIRYSDVEAKALAGMMSLWNKRGQSRLAILYGKQAVNVYQSIRSGNRTLDKDSQKSYMASHETSYRELANLLIDDGRLGEAQQVLDLLKEEEFLDFVRRDASEAVDQSKLALTDPERKALDEYTRLSSQLTSLGTRFQVLQDAKTKANGKLSSADEAEFQSLKTQIEEAGVGVRTFLSKLSQEFSKKVEDDAIITPASIEALRASLRSAGPDVVLVSTYLLPNRYRAIVTTGRTMVDRKVEYADQKLSQSIINRKISEFQRALQNPRVDPRPLGKELYDIFVKPLELDLDGAKAKTILWSLDGTLRYIPMAALSPDGKTYLAEKYQNVIVTLARQTNLFAKPAADEWRALGAGVSKPHEGFSALPSVINELNSIVRENGTTGVLDGKKLVDESFDLNSLRATLPQTTDDGKPFNVVHLATHFKLGSNDQESALLLGDGKRLSLFEINKDEELDFKDVELLALSACETGVSEDDGSGREVESLGMLAQKKGAKAVLATLWKIADEGTSMFMSEFYRLKKADPKLSKAEAIRLTQKEMIDGKIKASGQTGGCRAEDFGSAGKTNQFKCDPNAPFSHPYFWSPFVLIGNWR
jgi:CHAT domain-containing protein